MLKNRGRSRLGKKSGAGAGAAWKKSGAGAQALRIRIGYYWVINNVVFII